MSAASVHDKRAMRLSKLLGAAAFSLLGALLGWILIAPIAAVIGRRRDWLAVIGREDGKFVDNAKYFYLQATPLLAPAVRPVFVSERREVVEMLRRANCEALLYPSAKAIWFLLRSGTLVVDSLEWSRRSRFFLVIGAKIVQLWHGVGFKRIELGKWRNAVSTSRWLSSPRILELRIAMHRFTGRFVRYDAVNCTSVFYRDNVFAPAFLARHFLVAGYPRNAFGALDGEARDLVWKNVDARLVERLPAWRQAQRRIVLVAPTFRDSRATPMGLTADVISMLDDFCEKHGVEFVFKFHPFERQAGRVAGRHLHLCGPDTDLYPLMPLSSALVTDYSSIYMDYLLLDKPVLFLVPDIDEYVRTDRQMQFDFASMTPGPKAASWVELVDQLQRQWADDAFAAQRAELRAKAFDGLEQAQAVPKLLEFMRAERWLPDAGSAAPALLDH
jgi:CDP-glycerol glycerophosphotransferase (TagB/SpsB family)